MRAPSRKHLAATCLRVWGAVLISPILPINQALAQPQITSVSPSVADRGTATAIQLNVEHWQADDQITLSPGGPFLAATLDLPQAPQFLNRAGDLIYAASTDGSVYRIQLKDGTPHVLATARLPGPISQFIAVGETLISMKPGHGVSLWNWPAGKSPILSSSLHIDSPLAGMALNADQLMLATQPGHLILCTLQHLADEGPRLVKQWEFPLNAPVTAISATQQNVYFTGPSTGLGIVNIAQDGNPVLVGRFHKGSGAGVAIAVLDNKAYVADLNDGLVVYDVDKADSIRWLGSNSKSGGLSSVSAAEGHVYSINRGNRLLSLDTSNPELPITGSYFQLPSALHDLLRIDQQLVVASDAGLQIVDFSHEAALQISNEGINHGGSRRGFIRDGIAYVADWFSGLHLYDIRLPYAPRHLGNYHTAGSSKGVVVDGDLAYVGDDDHGLQIINISNPRQPVKVSEVATRGLAYTLTKRGNLIYLADHRGGIDIIDVTKPKQPRIIGSFATPSKAWAIDVKGPHAYVADDASGLLIFDVANPARIRQIAQFNPGGQAEDVVIQGDFAHVTFFEGVYSIIDISHPNQPRLISSTSIPGNARAVRLQGSMAYIAAWEGGLQVVDISDIKQPKVVAALDTDGSTWGLDLDEKYAYLWDWWGGIKVADISDPLQPRLITRYQAATAIQALAAQNNFLYAAQGSRGLQVYDITNPINPIWATGLDLPGAAQDIAVGETHAFIAMGDAGIGVANIADPFQVRWESRLNVGHSVAQVRVSGQRLLASDFKKLSLIDATDMQHLRQLKQLDYALNDLWLDGTTALLSRKAQGLALLDISDLNAPRELAHYGTESNFQLVRSHGDFIALVLGGKGIQLLQRKGRQLSELAFFQHQTPIQDIQFLDDNLYIASETTGLQRLSLSTPAQPRLITRYPATGPMQRLFINNEAAFFAGDTSITSITLLPKVNFRTTQEPNLLTLNLPADMPLGTYHLEVTTPQGLTSLLANAMQIKLPHPKKPKFTMDDFKRILQQRRQQGSQLP